MFADPYGLIKMSFAATAQQVIILVNSYVYTYTYTYEFTKINKVRKKVSACQAGYHTNSIKVAERLLCVCC